MWFDWLVLIQGNMSYIVQVLVAYQLHKDAPSLKVVVLEASAYIGGQLKLGMIVILDTIKF